jgi:hypothetical protein
MSRAERLAQGIEQQRVWPVLIDTDQQRLPAGIDVPSRAGPAEVFLALREKGWSPCRIWFDGMADAWVAVVIHTPDALWHP